jgi:hypothetical protein
VLCIDCGYDLRTGKKLKTVSRRFERTFGFNPATPARVGFAVVFILGALFFTAVVPLHELNPEHWGFFFFPVMALLLLVLAVALGTGGRITVTRSRKGHPELTRQAWFCFLPTFLNTFDLREWEAVYFNCVIGGDRSPDLYILELGRNRRDEFIVLYSGRDEETMKALGDAIKEVSGLRLERK